MDILPPSKLKLAIDARGMGTAIKGACLVAIVAAASYWTASRSVANGGAVYLHPAVMVMAMAASDAEEMTSLTTVLRRYTRDEGKAEHIASALIREGRKDKISPKLLLGVLLVENPWLDPSARSSVGATGLMQVMPFHRG
ncbi:MAG TPA: transglycosylase SLT domain-containing protein, partial [Gemmatimonadaceae bacterium]|nr:transglycosylase SLT domain-containing protein [Gemmatimonadaceae bacterium]